MLRIYKARSVKPKSTCGHYFSVSEKATCPVCILLSLRATLLRQDLPMQPSRRGALARLVACRCGNDTQPTVTSTLVTYICARYLGGETPNYLLKNEKIALNKLLQRKDSGV